MDKEKKDFVRVKSSSKWKITSDKEEILPAQLSETEDEKHTPEISNQTYDEPIAPDKARLKRIKLYIQAGIAVLVSAFISFLAFINPKRKKLYTKAGMAVLVVVFIAFFVFNNSDNKQTSVAQAAESTSTHNDENELYTKYFPDIRDNLSGEKESVGLKQLPVPTSETGKHDGSQASPGIIDDVQKNDINMRTVPESPHTQAAHKEQNNLPGKKEILLPAKKASAKDRESIPGSMAIDATETIPDKKVPEAGFADSTENTSGLNIGISEETISKIETETMNGIETVPDVTLKDPSILSNSIPEQDKGEIKTEIIHEIQLVGEIKEQSISDESMVFTYVPPVQDIEPLKNIKPRGGNFMFYKEPFNSNAGNWETYNMTMASARIKDGKYYIENKSRSGKHIILHHADFPMGNEFIVKTAIKTTKASADHAYGFVMGAMDASNSYVFQITGDESYSIERYQKGVAREISGGKIINKNFTKDSFNILKVERRGSKILFFINDHFVDEIPDISFFGNKVGFLVDGKSEIAVDYTHSQIWFE